MITMRLGDDALAFLKNIGKVESRMTGAEITLPTDVAQGFVRRVREGIEQQTRGFAPLSPKYAARKKGDPRILVSTGAYLRSIRATARGKGQAVVEAGSVGAFHERGTSRMPPRPHWAPALMEMQVSPKVQKLIREVFRDLLGG